MIMRLKRYMVMLRIFCVGGGYLRAEYLKKKHFFHSIGEHCYLQPWNFGTEPHLIDIGDNVHIASNVTFINHDISVYMLRYMNTEKKYKAKTGKIIIGNNVFIGANTTILYDVRIGNNVIIGAGSVVTKDIPDGVVAAGVPCRSVGTFKEFENKMIE